MMEPIDFPQQLDGRAKFLRSRGEIKTPELLERAARLLRDSDGTATAAANGDLPVPQDCQARPEGIAK
jgi:hypothetical protein